MRCYSSLEGKQQIGKQIIESTLSESYTYIHAFEVTPWDCKEHVTIDSISSSSTCLRARPQ